MTGYNFSDDSGGARMPSAIALVATSGSGWNALLG